MPPNKIRPEWVPEDGHHDFTTEVMLGVEGGHDGLPGMSSGPAKPRPPKPVLTPETGADGVLAGNRTILARAITMIESRSLAHRAASTELLRLCLPASGKSIRIGITGVPGAGKSTFIETFGLMLCGRGHKVAVLAVDPSSSVSGGSVLGDKTRMEDLSRHPAAFIRPSPSGGTLGGVAARTREAMLLCEAAGFDVILVETVGVGQSEIAVRGMVDFFLLLQIVGAGDELQGIKKGVIEMADAILVNKADGDNALRAETARGEYNRVLHYLHPFTPGWHPRALSCSAYTGRGVPEVWDMIGEFHDNLLASGVFEKRRHQQSVQWLHSLIREAVLGRFFAQASVQSLLPELERAVGAGDIPVAQAVETILRESISPPAAPGRMPGETAPI